MPIRCSSVHALALAAAWLVWVRGAGGADLTYTAPRACPDREELSFRIARSLGKPLASVASPRFEVVITASAAGFRATVRAPEEGATGSSEAGSPVVATNVRKLSAADCSQLVDAVSVAIVLAVAAVEIEHGAPADVAIPEGDGSASEASPPVAMAHPPTSDAALGEPVTNEPSAVSSGMRPGVFVSVLADVGSLPSAALGAGLGLQLGASSVRLRALVGAMLDQHVSLPARAGRTPGADLGLLIGAVSACYTPAGARLGSVSTGLCLGWELGRLSGRGTTVVPSRSGSALWTAPVLDLNLRAQLVESVALDFSLGGALPLNRNPFYLEDIGVVHRPASVVGRSALGVSWDFQ